MAPELAVRLATMVRGTLTLSMLIALLAGCPGGSGGYGDMCGGNSDCGKELQCLNSRCIERCQRAPDCGDGYACRDGLCKLATGQPGDVCDSEVQCAPGLSCQIDGAAVDSEQHLRATCTAENATRPAGSECREDGDCRNGTCALGHCVDLCKETTDCPRGTLCAPSIPSLVSPLSQATFSGCLPDQGYVTWPIPVVSPSAQILLPVPLGTASAALVMRVDDDSQKVGASAVISPSGARLYSVPCSPHQISDPPCDDVAANDMYFAAPVRHLPAFGQSVLSMPSGAAAPPLPSGVYRIDVSSFRADDSPGSAIPRVNAVIQLSPNGVFLDLHFFFLDLSDHPCTTMLGEPALDQATAQEASFFQADYLGELHAVFQRAQIELLNKTYEDIKDHPELDGLDLADVGSLLKLGKYPTGINVFFVRSLSPIGVQAFSPNPGPAGLGGTRQSGIVISLDTLCYRSWPVLARLTAHHIARYMGLYHNVEPQTALHPGWRDLIDDDDEGDPTANLMYFSEAKHPSGDTVLRSAGTVLSDGQRAILSRSPVLQSVVSP
ncbi:MAG TPA: hypothetical protein VFT22_19400 [Kofleriaceae bacterium]|nr:hypothetical protein [Kofleriaceae bacterium]